ncbi:MAG: hypothetical protein PVI75_06885 [Gammaproteobacteria bacterium]|jgi:hypothetical protein
MSYKNAFEEVKKLHKKSRKNIQFNQLLKKTDKITTVDDWEDKYPNFCCPIGLAVMIDPVTIPKTKQTYERKIIEDWFKNHDTCPMTNQRLTEDEKKLTTNQKLKTDIKNMIKDLSKTPNCVVEHYNQRNKELYNNDDVIKMDDSTIIENWENDHMGYCCPLTSRLMIDPVSIVTGRTYEREAIEKWLKNNNTDPMTKEKLPYEFDSKTGEKKFHKTLYPQKKIKSKIKELVNNQETPKCVKEYYAKRSAKEIKTNTKKIKKFFTIDIKTDDKSEQNRVIKLVRKINLIGYHISKVYQLLQAEHKKINQKTCKDKHTFSKKIIDEVFALTKLPKNLSKIKKYEKQIAEIYKIIQGLELFEREFPKTSAFICRLKKILLALVTMSEGALKNIYDIYEVKKDMRLNIWKNSTDKLLHMKYAVQGFQYINGVVGKSYLNIRKIIKDFLGNRLDLSSHQIKISERPERLYLTVPFENNRVLKDMYYNATTQNGVDVIKLKNLVKNFNPYKNFKNVMESVKGRYLSLSDKLSPSSSFNCMTFDSWGCDVFNDKNISNYAKKEIRKLFNNNSHFHTSSPYYCFVGSVPRLAQVIYLFLRWELDKLQKHISHCEFITDCKTRYDKNGNWSYINLKTKKVYPEKYIQQLFEANKKHEDLQLTKIKNIINSIEDIKEGNKQGLNEYIKQNGSKSIMRAMQEKILVLLENSGFKNAFSVMDKIAAIISNVNKKPDHALLNFYKKMYREIFIAIAKKQPLKLSQYTKLITNKLNSNVKQDPMNISLLNIINEQKFMETILGMGSKHTIENLLKLGGNSIKNIIKKIGMEKTLILLDDVPVKDKIINIWFLLDKGCLDIKHPATLMKLIMGWHKSIVNTFGSKKPDLANQLAIKCYKILKKCDAELNNMKDFLAWKQKLQPKKNTKTKQTSDLSSGYFSSSKSVKSTISQSNSQSFRYTQLSEFVETKTKEIRRHFLDKFVYGLVKDLENANKKLLPKKCDLLKKCLSNLTLSEHIEKNVHYNIWKKQENYFIKLRMLGLLTDEDYVEEMVTQASNEKYDMFKDNKISNELKYHALLRIENDHIFQKIFTKQQQAGYFWFLIKNKIKNTPDMILQHEPLIKTFSIDNQCDLLRGCINSKNIKQEKQQKIKQMLYNLIENSNDLKKLSFTSTKELMRNSIKDGQYILLRLLTANNNNILTKLRANDTTTSMFGSDSEGFRKDILKCCLMTPANNCVKAILLSTYCDGYTGENIKQINQLIFIMDKFVVHKNIGEIWKKNIVLSQLDDLCVKLHKEKFTNTQLEQLSRVLSDFQQRQQKPQTNVKYRKKQKFFNNKKNSPLEDYITLIKNIKEIITPKKQSKNFFQKLLKL